MRPARSPTPPTAFLPIFCRLVGCDPQLLELPPAEALGAQLRMFVVLTLGRGGVPLDAGGEARIECLAVVGADKPARSVRDAARRTLAGAGSTAGGSAGSSLFPCCASTVRLLRSSLGWRAAIEDVPQQVAGEIAAALAPVLERAAMLEQSSERDRVLSDSANRRLARLGFDIHDGPLQDVVALLADVRLYRVQLERELSAGASKAPLVGRIDDFEARLLVLVEELRDLAEWSEPTGVLSGELGEVLEREAKQLRSGGVERPAGGRRGRERPDAVAADHDRPHRPGSARERP